MFIHEPRNHARRVPRKCPGCLTGDCPPNAILCRRCWRTVPEEISQWLRRANDRDARVAAVRRILEWIGGGSRNQKAEIRKQKAESRNRADAEGRAS